MIFMSSPPLLAILVHSRRGEVPKSRRTSAVQIPSAQGTTLPLKPFGTRSLPQAVYQGAVVPS
jgi:hypothetical protein